MLADHAASCGANVLDSLLANHIAGLVAYSLLTAFLNHSASRVGANLALLLANHCACLETYSLGTAFWNHSASCVANGLAAALWNHSANIVSDRLGAALRIALGYSIRNNFGQALCFVPCAVDFLGFAGWNPDFLADRLRWALNAFYMARAWAVYVSAGRWVK